MCLPGLLSREASRPNEAARNQASWLRIVLYALIFVAVLRLLSFSLWSFFLDLLLALYGLMFLRQNFDEPDRIVLLESVILFETLFAANSLIGVLTLVSLITESTLLSVPIQQWQQIFGYIVSGCALAVYLAGLVSIHLLYRALKETTLVTADEASGLMPGRVSQPVSSERRFPGTGYKIGAV